MSIIIAGMFESIDQAEGAAESLRRHHFATHDVCHFAQRPAGAAAGAGADALGESFVALEKLEGKGSDDRPLRSRSSVMVAVRVNGAAEERTAIQVLEAEGASHIERVEGEWKEGRWADFHSVVEPRLVSDGPVSSATSPAAGYRDAGKVMAGGAHQKGTAGVRRGR